MARLLPTEPQPLSLSIADDERGGASASDGASWPETAEDFASPPPTPVRSRVDRDADAEMPPESSNSEPAPEEDDSDLDLALSGDDPGIVDEEAESETDEPAPAESPLPPTPLDAEAAAKKHARRRQLIVAGAVMATLLLCLGGLVALQQPITRAIPGMAALYHLVGLAPAPPGADLDIAEVTSSREWEGGEDLLIVTGTVTNTAEEPRAIPPLRVTLFDAADRQVQETIVEPEKAVLAPSEQVHFSARIANPASTARRMIVSFDTSAAGNS